MGGRSSGVVVEIVAEAGAWPELEIMRTHITRAIDAAALSLADRGHRVPEGAEVSVLLTDDQGIRALNKRFRGRATATNVLSFPGAGAAGPHAHMLGDMALAWETVASEAAAAALTIDHHVTHLVIHGFLHILGFDHEEDVQAAGMERLEVEILAGLGVDDPYGDVVTDPISTGDTDLNDSPHSADAASSVDK